MNDNPLKKLETLGQSIWLNYIRCDLINVNVTLLFGLPRYRQVIKAYIASINDRFDQGKPIKNIASVASFFLSCINAVIDPKKEKFVALGGEQAHFVIKIRGRLPFQALKLPIKFIKKHLKANSSLNWLIKVRCISDCFWPVPALKIPNNRK